jgi:TRAP-type uncharacterized transport system substrate-binding protein
MAQGSEHGIGFKELTGLSVGRAVLAAVPALALIVGSIWLAVQFLDPMPPRRIVVATGPEGSALHALGMRYAERVTAQGIAVDLRPTAGPAEDVARLVAREGRVDAALLPAGTADADQARQIVNVANLFYAPLWALSRDASGDLTLAGLKGRRVAIGPPGSGLNMLLRPLLAANGVTPANTTLLETAPQDSVQALAAGEADVIFLGEGLRGPDLERALALPGVRVMNFPRADAYARRFTHVVSLRLPAGTLDLERGIPDRELALIGTTVMLAARVDLHPTAVDLLYDVARQLHSGPGLFEQRGEFPHLHAVDQVPVSPQAVLHARTGPSLLRRYLPLWVADAIQRAIVLAIPLVAVVVPLVRMLPSILDVIGRRRLFLGYARLRRVERRLRSDAAPDEDLLRELDRIEDDVTSLEDSVFKAGELYTFRVHVRVVRESIRARSAATQAVT